MAILNDIVTALVTVSQGINLQDTGKPARVRDLNDTPVALNQGDCPQVIHSTGTSSERRLTFTGNDYNVPKGRFDYEIVVYFVDQAVNLGTIWQTRPRVVAYISDFLDAIQRNDFFYSVNTYSEVKTSGAADNLKYSGGATFRGAIFRVHVVRFM